jgi:hypothetical protein
MSYAEAAHARADLVVETDAFLAREEAGTGEGTYHLRDGGRAVVVRHGTADVGAFGAVWGERVYDPPAEARLAILRGAGPRRVVDLRARTGLAAAYLLGLWPGARVTAIEADPADRAVLERCARANAGAGEWEVLGALAPAEALARCAGADVVRLEAGGPGWALLADPALGQAGLGAVAVAYRPDGAPSPDPAADVDRLLRAAGLTPRFAFETGGAGLFWGWR